MPVAAVLTGSGPQAAMAAKTKKGELPGRPTHAALLRGINVGGSGVIAMADLRTIFDRAGAKQVRTILASGNVLFAAADVEGCMAKVRAALDKRAGKPMPIMLRSLDDLRALVAAQPFGAGTVPKGETWYVSFLDRVPDPVPALPLTVPTGDVTYLALHGHDLCAKVTALPGKPSVENYKPETLFKVNATTRNWNTVLKLIKETP